MACCHHSVATHGSLWSPGLAQDLGLSSCKYSEIFDADLNSILYTGIFTEKYITSSEDFKCSVGKLKPLFTQCYHKHSSHFSFLWKYEHIHINTCSTLTWKHFSQSGLYFSNYLAYSMVAIATGII